MVHKAAGAGISYAPRLTAGRPGRLEPGPAAISTPAQNAAPPTIADALAALRAGGLVAMPTETVYGLAADARNPAAVRQIFAAKGRPADHPLIVHLADAAQVHEWASDVPPAAQTLMRACWPGPLTLILPKAAAVDPVVTGGQDSVGLRVPAHPVAHALLSAFGGGLAAPSANRFGRISPTTAAHVREEFPDLDLCILDGGASQVGLESTIVDLSAAAPRLLRPGHITRAQIEALIGPLQLPADHEGPRASGRLAAHYAPTKPLDLVPAEALAGYRAEHGEAIAWLSAGPLPAGCQGLALPSASAGYAQALYAALRTLDATTAKRIAVLLPPDSPDWAAVHDRLRRAAVGGGRHVR